MFGIAVLLATMVLAVSCVGLLALDSYSGAIGDLCNLLTQCYGEGYYPQCTAHGGPRLSNAAADARANWLMMFADTGCLENCTNARSCLDGSPLCLSRGGGCQQTEECCGFTSGSSECQGGGCCLRPGIACSSGAECCDGACDKGFCGGVECKASGQACKQDYECCTQICDRDAHRCSDQICLPEGAECADSQDCCGKYCELSVEVGGSGVSSGVCSPPVCAPDGVPCVGAGECCGDYCVAGDDKVTAYCSQSACLPDGTPCANDASCCSQSCDLQFGACGPPTTCAPRGEQCNVNGDCCEGSCNGANCCAPPGAQCTGNSECCDNLCNNNLECEASCLPANAPCSIADPAGCCSARCSDNGQCCDQWSCNHGVCQYGGPLSPNCVCSSCGGGNGGLCVATVCEAKPACCCGAWDTSCVALATALCGVTCPINP